MVHHDNTYVHSFGVFFLILNSFLAADMTTEGNSLLKESNRKNKVSVISGFREREGFNNKTCNNRYIPHVKVVP